MIASTIMYNTHIYIDIVSYAFNNPYEIATAVWPWIIVGIGAAVLGGIAVFKIASAIMSHQLRELQKPAVDE